MIGNERHRQAQDLVLQLGDHGQAREDLDAPAAPGDPPRDGVERPLGGAGVAIAVRLEVHAHAAHAGPGQRFELGVGRAVGVDDGHAARLVPEPLQRRQQARIVCAVRARLHEHEPAHADPALEREQIVHRGRARRVAALRRVREMLRVEDVNVAVAGARRDREPRLGVVPAWRLLQGSAPPSRRALPLSPR